LSGQVSSEEDKKQAERLVAAVKGVSRVDNRLEMLRSAVIQKQIDQILTRKLEFEPGETALAADSMPAMEELRAVLARAAVFSIRVDSFTDNAGPADKNRVLSQLRAQEVVNWLAGHGIARERMQATGHGPDRAIASNDSAEGRARNRRIEITVNER
jgi:OOP family OmpA-OmpF porin